MAQERRTPVDITNQRGIGTGPYLARIVGHLDPSFMGGLAVTLLRSQGNNMGEDTQTYTVRCAQPFFGYTGYEFMGQNSTIPKQTQGEQALNQRASAQGSTTQEAFNDTQKSYGMWFVPPDVGVTVLVVFVDGDPSQGYWIGCIPSRFGNHMVPAIGGSKELDIDADDKKKYGVNQDYNKKTPLPVAEVNRRLNEGDQVIDVEKIPKAVHPIADAFLQQGLLEDDVRGVTTTTSRREAPSMVFGISTPGPLDRRTNAKKANIGTIEGQTQSPVPVSRLGGTQFVMDDGDDRYHRASPASTGPVKYIDIVEKKVVGTDEKVNDIGEPTIPYNEYFRVRTRTGHQILMHNSEDLIYIANSKGTTWIELTSNGKIDIYAQDSVSVHTQTDLNIRADRDINLEAGRNFNVKAAGRFNGDFGANIHLRAGMDGKITVGTSLDVLVATDAKLTFGANLDIGVASATKITTQGATDIFSGGALKVTTSAALDIKAATDGKLTVGGSMNVGATGGKINLTSGSDTNIKAGGRFTQNAAGYFSLPAGGGIAAVTATAEAATAASQAIAAVEAPPLSVHTLPATSPVDWATTKYQAGTITSIMKRVPMHEPWLLHENQAPDQLKPTDTDREVAGSLAPGYVAATEASIPKEVVVHTMETNDYDAQVPGADGKPVIPTKIDIPTGGALITPEFFAPSKYGKRTADALNTLDPSVRPVFAKGIKAFIDLYFKEGWDMSVSEGLRPLARSQALYDAYKAGTGPQAASPGNSWHNFGAAIDILVYKNGVWDSANKFGAYTGIAQQVLRTYGAHNNAGANDCGHFVPLQMTKGVPKSVKSGAITIAQIMSGEKTIT